VIQKTGTNSRVIGALVQDVQHCDHLRTNVQPDEHIKKDGRKMKMRNTDGASARWFKAFNTATTSGLLHNQISPPKRTNENENEKYSRDITLA
jgi:hypothetical protein